MEYKIREAYRTMIEEDMAIADGMNTSDAIGDPSEDGYGTGWGGHAQGGSIFRRGAKPKKRKNTKSKAKRKKKKKKTLKEAMEDSFANWIYQWTRGLELGYEDYVIDEMKDYIKDCEDDNKIKAIKKWIEGLTHGYEDDVVKEMEEFHKIQKRKENLDNIED